MTFEDARKIMGGGNTAATEFFKQKTHGKLYDAFKPMISSNMDEVGATRSYKEMMGKYESIFGTMTAELSAGIFCKGGVCSCDGKMDAKAKM